MLHGLQSLPQARETFCRLCSIRTACCKPYRVAVSHAKSFANYAAKQRSGTSYAEPLQAMQSSRNFCERYKESRTFCEHEESFASYAAKQRSCSEAESLLQALHNCIICRRLCIACKDFTTCKKLRILCKELCIILRRLHCLCIASVAYASSISLLHLLHCFRDECLHLGRLHRCLRPSQCVCVLWSNLLQAMQRLLQARKQSRNLLQVMQQGSEQLQAMLTT